MSPQARDEALILLISFQALVHDVPLLEPLALLLTYQFVAKQLEAKHVDINRVVKITNKDFFIIFSSILTPVFNKKTYPLVLLLE